MDRLNQLLSKRMCRMYCNIDCTFLADLTMTTTQSQSTVANNLPTVCVAYITAINHVTWESRSNSTTQCKIRQ
eukprot:scaffold145_cov195-Alexandrium_tamarense.AAC.56